MLQETLSTAEYESLMMDETDELLESRIDALREIEKEKIKVAKAYNKHIQENHFKLTI
jgi:PHD/YefM family antitoxin component YafN of YafNO toxin-antitoxin module